MRLKTFLFTGFILFSSFLTNAQYQDFHIKEHFDYMYVNSYQSGRYPYDDYEYFTPSFTCYDKDSNLIWCSNDNGFYLSTYWTLALEGLLIMYETTGDKEYLYTFMREATQVIRTRRDFVFGSNYDPLWFRRLDLSGNIDVTGNGVSAVFNGRILMVLAHFYYIVQSDYSLATTPIELYTGEDRNELYNGFNTFGWYADWVGSEVDITLNWTIYHMWRNGDCNGNSGISHSYANERLGAFNYQTPYAMAFLYMYLGNNSYYYQYGVKAVEIAQLILGNGCNDVTTNTLEYNSSNDSYWWMHEPWKPGSSWYYEDLGHGTWDIMFPLLYNKHKSSIYNHVTMGQYFEDFQLARLRNTFTRNIWEDYYVCCGGQIYDGFHMAVNGTTGTQMWPPWNSYSFDDQTPRLFGMAYMPLYRFDDYPSNSAPNVYNILMDMYNNYAQYLTDAWADKNVGGTMKGWADMVTAHWDKECYSLYLDNRVCYYDQEFYAKDYLYVGIDEDDPNYPENPHYCKQLGTDYNGGKFVIKSGVTVNFKAGTQVIFGDNFEVEPGGNFTVTNNYQPCGGPVPPIRERKPISNEEDIELNGELINIYPNPANETVTIEFNILDNEKIKTVHIISATGEKILFPINSTSFGNGIFSYSTEHLANGVYFIQIISDKRTSSRKFIVQH